MATWNLDSAHSEIEFKVKHMMISTVKGRFENFNVTVTDPSGDLEKASILAEIQADSVTTKNEQRDQHLRSGDFFNAEAFPTITFRSTGIRSDGDGGFKLSGDLTIRGVTQPITLDVEFGGSGKDPWGNQKAGYTVTGKLNRSDFGLTWNTALEAGGVLVNEEVKFQADLQFVVS